MAKEEKRERRTLLCVGLVRVKGSKKLAPEFVLVDADGNAIESETFCWSVRATVGHVYEVEIVEWSDAKKVIVPSTLSWRSFYRDEAKRVEWEARAEVTKAERGRAAAQKKAEKSRALRESLVPLAKAYQKLIMTNDRRAFLAFVVAEIANPKTAKET